MKDYGFFENLAYNGVVRRTKKRGKIECYKDLKYDHILKDVMKYEEKRIEKRKEINPWFSLASLPGSAIETITSINRTYAGERLVPAEPAYNTTTLMPIGKAWDIPITTYHEATPERYESVYNYFVAHPWLLGIAIAIPVSIFTYLYAREKWLNYCEDFITKKNIKEKTENKILIER